LAPWPDSIWPMGHQHLRGQAGAGRGRRQVHRSCTAPTSSPGRPAREMPSSMKLAIARDQEHETDQPPDDGLDHRLAATSCDAGSVTQRPCLQLGGHDFERSPLACHEEQSLALGSRHEEGPLPPRTSRNARGRCRRWAFSVWRRRRWIEALLMMDSPRVVERTSARSCVMIVRAAETFAGALDERPQQVGGLRVLPEHEVGLVDHDLASAPPAPLSTRCQTEPRACPTASCRRDSSVSPRA